MKRIFLLCSLLVMVGLNGSAQSRYVMLEGLVDTSAGMVYNQPQSTLVIDLSVEREQVVAGPYARYALKYLGARAPFSDKSSWRLKGAEIALLDEQELFAAPLAEDQLQRINPVAEGATFSELSADHIDLLHPADEEAAMLAAKRIFQLRRTRLELISGEVGEHVFGQGLDSALKEIGRQEQALVELFLGKRTLTVEHHRLYLTPQSNKKQYILCRFSAQSGLLPSSDLSGEIVLLDITPGAPYAVQEAPEKSSSVVACRVAAPCGCSVQMAGEELVVRTLPLFEYGRTVRVLSPRK